MLHLCAAEYRQMKKPGPATFLKLERELKPYMEVMGTAADAIVEKGISDYPVLVIHQQQIELGIPVVKRDEVEGNWSVNASTLEEFVMKNVIQQDKTEDFQSIYKDPSEYLCLFILSELGAQFIFVKR